MEHLLATLGALLLIYHVGFDLTVMVSPSMSPTLQGTRPEDGDWVLMERVSYWFRKPRRWEVVAFLNTDGTPVMKRVVGLPGERIHLRDGQVEINGEVVPFPASIANLRYFPYGTLANRRPADCGGGYFVLGDDTQDSQDSRYEGTVALPKIRGRSWLIVWPLSRIRFVTP